MKKEIVIMVLLVLYAVLFLDSIITITGSQRSNSELNSDIVTDNNTENTTFLNIMWNKTQDKVDAWLNSSKISIGTNGHISTKLTTKIKGVKYGNI